MVATIGPRMDCCYLCKISQYDGLKLLVFLLPITC